MSSPLCSRCSEPVYVDDPSSYEETCVGYFSPPGHNHDDNCRRIRAACSNGHVATLSIRRRCPACDWVGKAACWCHPNGKVDAWPMRPAA